MTEEPTLSPSDRQALEYWADLSHRVKLLLADALEAHDSVVPTALTLAEISAELLRSNSANAEELERQLKHFAEMVSGMAREKFYAASNQPGTPS